MSDGDIVVRLAARGDGQTADGRFAQGVAPGDRVAVDGSITRGANHVEPPCRHVPDCGGCQLQHVGDAAYAIWASARIADALRQHGLSATEMMPVHLSPPRSRRRAALRAVRRGRQVMLGFNTEGSHRLVDLRECHILLPELFGLVAPVRALLGTALRDGQGAGVTLTMTATGIDLLLANVPADSLAEIERLTDFANSHDLARLSVEGPGGVDVITERRTPELLFGGVRVAVPPAPFLQATADGEAALVAAVEIVTAGAARIADLFCGLGTFALPLSSRARVLAADAAGPAVTALSFAARMAGRPVQALHRDLFRQPLTATDLAKLDAVVIDPPRAGAADQMRAVAAARVPVVAAVSCNPNTFARDAAILCAAGYCLDRIWPVGQFRWSTHVEMVACFRRPA